MKTIEEALNNPAINTGLLMSSVIQIAERSFKSGVEFAQRWIPIEEEFPQENIPVLVKMDYCFAFTDIIATDVCYLRLNRWINALRNEHSNSNVIAWRPIEYK